MKASEVANELRRIADALAGSDLDIDPFLVIHTTERNKESFQNLAKIMPKPMVKGVDFLGTSYEDFKLSHEFWAIKTSRSTVCHIKEPAKPAVYECDPIFSTNEEDELAEAK